MEKQVQVKEIIKAKLETLHHLSFPNSPDRKEGEYASTYADLVLLDSQLEGLIVHFLLGNFDADRKKQFIILRDALGEELDALKDRKKDYIIRYFRELFEIVNMVEV